MFEKTCYIQIFTAMSSNDDYKYLSRQMTVVRFSDIILFAYYALLYNGFLEFTIG